MLQLGTGMQTIEGVTVFPDHADEEQYWYLPAHLSIARRPEDDWPQFTFMKFKREATDEGVEGGGFLMFTVELTLPEDVERDDPLQDPGERPPQRRRPSTRAPSSASPSTCRGRAAPPPP